MVGTSPEVVLDRSDTDAMVSERLDSSDREQLLSLLCEFAAIVDIGGCPLGVARRVPLTICICTCVA